MTDTDSRPALNVGLVRTREALSSLEADWNDLIARSATWWASQTFPFALAGLENDAGAQPLIVTVRRAERLMALWPLRNHPHGNVTVASPIGCGVDDAYVDILMDPDEDPEILARLCLGALGGAVDVMWFNLVPRGSALARALRVAGLIRHTGSMESFVVELQASGDWNTWLKSKSRSFRQGLVAQRRVLERAGAVEFRVNPPGFLPWFFETKRRHLRALGERSALVETDQAERFFDTMTRIGPHTLNLALTLDGRFVGGGICMIGKQALEYYATTYDPEFARFSPGTLMTSECAQFALSLGLDFDMRITARDYKDRWTSRVDDYETFVVALTGRGVMIVAVQNAAGLVHRGRKAAAAVLSRWLPFLTRSGRRRLTQQVSKR